MKDRTAIACTLILAFTLVGCTAFMTHVIRDATAQIINDDSDDDDQQATPTQADHRVQSPRTGQMARAHKAVRQLKGV